MTQLVTVAFSKLHPASFLAFGALVAFVADHQIDAKWGLLTGLAVLLPGVKAA